MKTGETNALTDTKYIIENSKLIMPQDQFEHINLFYVLQPSNGYIGRTVNSMTIATIKILTRPSQRVNLAPATRPRCSCTTHARSSISSRDCSNYFYTYVKVLRVACM